MTAVQSKAQVAPKQRFGILSSWNFLKQWPLGVGSWLFDWLVAWTNPYSASIPYKTVTISPGHCIMTMPDKYKLHNPFKSIHAAALVNLGELCSGMAILSAFEAVSEYQKNATSDNNVIVSYRGIVKSLDATYFKKARGALTAVCQVGAGKGATRFDKDEVSQGTCHYVSDQVDEDQVKVVADIYDSEHELVARIGVVWNVKKKEETYGSCHAKSKNA